MNRRPPKLVPIERKLSTSSETKNSLECMPPLKPGCSLPATASDDSSPAPPRRSGLTRHFLNCNGNSTNNKRRFSAKLPATAPSAAGNLRPAALPKEGNRTSNGCNEPIPIAIPNKVNGTISNGISTKPSDPSKQLIDKNKVFNDEGEESSSSDSHQNSSITFTNGKKTQSSNSNNSVTSSSSNSQHINLVNTTKRTSRVSQVSNVSSKVPASHVSSSPSPSVDDSMPALVAYDDFVAAVKNEFPPKNSTKDDVLDNQESSANTEVISEEPKIIRKGDTVIKSYVDEKTGKITVFEKEMKLEVCDFGSGKWYPAKVKNIDWTEQNILVHYSNWSSRYDEWISMKSNRVRPSEDTNVIRREFFMGERVEALWPMDSKRYPGTVTQILHEDLYEVTFDDGIKMKRSGNQLFKVSPSDPPQSAQSTIKKPEVAVSQPVSKPVPKLIPKPSIPASEEKVPTKVVKRRRVVKPTVKVRENSQSVQAPVPAPQLPPPTDSTLSDPANRPTHFSVFDPPQEELGKRKRTVHDYSILVRGKTPVVKGPRRPKSEGAAISTDASDIIPDLYSIADEDGLEEMDSSAKITSEPSVDSTPPPRRRKKSGVGTHVPTKPSLESPKELPAIEEKEKEPIPIVEKAELPLKKRKTSPQPAPISSDVTTTDGKSETTLTSQVPSEVAPVPATSTLNVHTTSTTSSTTISRRAKSLGSSLTQPAAIPVHSDVPKDTKVDSGFADEMGNPIIIEVNQEDGFWKCPLKNCGKNFRKDSLLKMHLKHYHPELIATRGVANVVQMAQARTAYENEHPSEHHQWQKVPNLDQDGSSDTASDTLGMCEVIEKRKSSKENSPEKLPPHLSHKSEDSMNSTPTFIDLESSQESLKSLARSPRLRLMKRRSFAVSKIGRYRANNRHSFPARGNFSSENLQTTVMETDSCTSPKKSKFYESFDASQTSNGELTASPASSSHIPSRLPSPAKADRRVDQFSVGAGSANSGPYLAAAFGESAIGESNRPPRGRPARWNKPLRRSIINQNRRRVGSNIIPTSTSLYFKKRLQIRKFIGKRSRPKRTSILSRISSGRMRVILEALNQRSLKKKRFRAVRRFRDVKVDVINCICTSKTEFGLMIQCELCLCWQHGSCFNVQSNSQLPEFYACQSCSEPERVRLSRKHDWAEAEFYKLGKLPSFPFAPSFPKEDARIMKTCTNLTSNIVETYSMIKGLKLKERICFLNPEHPQLYQWNTQRIPPSEEIQKDKFNKYFQPVLRRLLLENKSDGVYNLKLKKLAEIRLKLRKYTEAVETARLTIKKKLGYRAAAYLSYICDSVLDDMVKVKRRSNNIVIELPGMRKESLECRKRSNAEQAYHRLAKLKDDLVQHQRREQANAASEDRLSTFENGMPASPSLSSSPVKTELGPFITNLSKSSSPNKLNSLHLPISPKPGGVISSTSSNGLKKDIAAGIRDIGLLKRYLKERRSIDTNIRSTVVRVSKQFPEEWKNLMKLARGFVDNSKRETVLEEKFKWITNVIFTFNTLRILLKQIYSECSGQKQRNYCSEFEKAGIKLFDLFGIGVMEEQQEGKGKRHPKKLQRGLETLETLDTTSLAVSVLLQDDELKSCSSTDPVEVSDNVLSQSDCSSEKIIKIENDEDPSTPNEEAVKQESDLAIISNLVKPGLTTADNKDDPIQQITSTLVYHGCRNLDGKLISEVSEKVSLANAALNFALFPTEEEAEGNISLKFPEEEEESSTKLLDASDSTGIIPIPATSRITPDVCKKNLVRDILLQQQQIDLYLDKIEAQVLQLSSHSRHSGAVSLMTPAEMSTQRDKMLHSLELVARLAKTQIGENDIVEDPINPEDVSETTFSDSSDLDSSSESDGDNTSNISGTDTETADEGDSGDDDDLLDI